MATVNLSSKFENNLRRTSGVGVATLCAVVGDTGARLTSAPSYALAADDYIAYCIPADSIVTKIFFVVDEVFAAGAAHISTIVDDTALVAALDLTTLGATAGILALDTYFDSADGFKFELSDDATAAGGKVRAICEYISLDTNEGSYVEVVV